MRNKQSDRATSTIASSQAVRDIVGREKLAELMRREDRPAFLHALFHLSCLCTSGCFLYLSLEKPWFVPALLLHGFFVVRLFAPYHEASHGTTFKTRWMNNTLYWVTGLILMLPPLAFKYEHADHHTFTQDPKRDPQYVQADNIREYLWYGSAIPYFFNIFRNLLLQPFGWMSSVTKRAVPENERKKVQLQAVTFCLVYASLAVYSIWYETWSVVIFWLAPRMLMEPVERLIRMTEHVCCPKTPNMMENSRTVIINRLFSILSWNMPCHSAHHAAPLVPFHALPELTHILKEHIRHYEYGMAPTVFRSIKTLITKPAPVNETQQKV